MKINAEAILETLAKIRKSIPYKLTPRVPQRRETPIDNVTDFELGAIEEALEQLTAELGDAVDAARARALEGALNVYYAAEELARDPANAHLIPHVEAMRRAYEHDYGKPIPPRS
jgi:hypothetical protein